MKISHSDIPKILHKIWMSPKEDGIPTPIPQTWKDWDRDCQTLHPGWTHITWNEKTMRDFVRKETPHLLATYDSYPAWIQRCDAFRYIVLYRMGGVYLDMDSQCIEPLDELIKDKHCILNQPWSNHFMAAEPRHPMFKKCMDRLPSHKGRNTIWDSTGPAYLRNCYEDLSNKEGIDLIPEPYIPVKHISGKSWWRTQIMLWIKKYWWILLIIVLLLVTATVALILWKKGRYRQRPSTSSS